MQRFFSADCLAMERNTFVSRVNWGVRYHELIPFQFNTLVKMMRLHENLFFSFNFIWAPYYWTKCVTFGLFYSVLWDSHAFSRPDMLNVHGINYTHNLHKYKSLSLLFICCVAMIAVAAVAVVSLLCIFLMFCFHLMCHAKQVSANRQSMFHFFFLFGFVRIIYI